MAKCIYCHQKKGKRTCNALNGDICNLCCGKHRGTDIRCPASCTFISGKETYYIQKDEDDFLKHMVNFYNDICKNNKESGKNFLAFVDARLYEHFHSNRSSTDSKIISILNSLRSKLSPIQLISQPGPMSTESFCDGVEEFIDRIGINNENAIKILDLYIAQLEEYVDNETDSNKWIRQFLNLVESKNPDMCRKIKNKESSEKDIIYTGEKFEDSELIRKDENKPISNIIIP